MDWDRQVVTRLKDIKVSFGDPKLLIVPVVHVTFLDWLSSLSSPKALYLFCRRWLFNLKPIQRLRQWRQLRKRRVRGLLSQGVRRSALRQSPMRGLATHPSTHSDCPLLLSNLIRLGQLSGAATRSNSLLSVSFSPQMACFSPWSPAISWLIGPWRLRKFLQHYLISRRSSKLWFACRALFLS